MYDRLISLIGKENFDILSTKKVAIIGIGGVGGFAFEALIRSGIKNIMVIDGDKFEISNLNRQILSNKNNIGDYKTNIAINHAKDINDEINIIGVNEFINSQNINILEGYDYIIDACDDIDAKVEIIKYAINNNIKIISCLGSGKKIDPSKVEVTTLDKTYNDPLAKKLRNLLNKENINLKIPVVFSSELPINNDVKISSCIIVPAICGINLSSFVINDILKK